jgi:predicted alpha/beta hydrolase family esterase
MARSSILDFRILIVPGLHGSGPDHWQSRWQRLYPYFERIEQAQWDVPDLAAWSEQLDRVLRISTQPALIVAHSFGCLTTVHCAASTAPNILGALLVAPADPRKFGISEILRKVKLPFASIMISSTNDPWMKSRCASYWASVWGSEFVNAGALGHINAESNLGDWRLGLSKLQCLAATVPSNGYSKAVCQRGVSEPILQFSV